MAKISMTIDQIEHGEDLNNAKQAIVKAGGEILESEPNFEEENCLFIVDIGDRKAADFEQRVDEILSGEE